MPARIPAATYRLQLRKGFGFPEVQALADYLHDLGVSDVYTAPILKARAGSAHGYDVVDHTQPNPELGSYASLELMADHLRELGMGLLVDVVPNHMCVATHENAWWNDVLENGPSSPFAAYFDIDWRPPKPDLRDRVLLPILGDQFGRVLEAGELRVLYNAGALSLAYYDWSLPLAPKSWSHVLQPAVDLLRQSQGEEFAGLAILESVLVAIRNLPPRSETDPEKIRERAREKEIIKARLAVLVDESEPVRAAVLESVDTINGVVGDPRSFDALDAMLGDQAYRVAHWRVASDEINYRRFFDINDLAALRVEEPVVFEDVHQVVLDLVQSGRVTGLRIDHVDGLLDPTAYLQNLEERCGPGGAYIVVEKIHAEGQALPAHWPIHGTTGYEFLNLVGGLFVEPAGTKRLIDLYRAATGITDDYANVVYACKKLVLDRAMSSEIAMLSRRLDRISEQHRRSRDFTLRDLRKALVEIVACLSVYRTYVRPGSTDVDAHDRRVIDMAVQRARRRNADMPSSLFEFLRTLLKLEHPEGLTDDEMDQRRQFVLRLQQLTGGVTAKALEDTAFYRFYPLSSQGEVGGSPVHPSVSVEYFHRQNIDRFVRHPHTQLSTATHDTKRGEDVRARIRVLSEMPEAWGRLFARFRALNAPHRIEVDGCEVPDANEEYLLYQTLIGMWPFQDPDAEGRAELLRRVQAYMQKALREAKIHTSWVSPDEEWEGAVERFVAAILRDTPDNEFMRALVAFQRPLARVAVYGSLAQVLLKCTAPGVPDFYQGAELWELSLVDPDNRRPVDFEQRRSMLKSIRACGEDGLGELVESLLKNMSDGAIKMFVTHRALTVRRRQRAVFSHGEYIPLEVSGHHADRVVAFARVYEDDVVVTVVGRWFSALGAAEAPPVGEQVWKDTTVTLSAELAEHSYVDALTGRRVTAASDSLLVGDIFALLPLALLERRRG